ncbi:hypothetical protein LTR84_002490 [Exophiala bonariae]|uniref:GST N-terminal domain-containing protein n=1 Tax=Exophiala bonariae TaxID=1690606 RepID=A0AAV9N9H3_9EURO|nr:hypothetical protein LTR84_002490 [Exophiala bonariae]
MSLKIYCLHYAASDRVVWLCEELSELVPSFKYELFVYERGMEASEGKKMLVSLHAAGTAPTMVDSTVSPTITLAESGAIIEYLIHVHGQGHFSVSLSAGPHAYAEYSHWYNWAGASFQAFLDANLLGQALTALKGAPIPEDGMAYLVHQAFKNRTLNHLKQLDDRLARSKYLAGNEITAVEFYMIFSLTTFRVFLPVDLAGHANVLRYLADITARPAYRRTMEKAEKGLQPLIQPLVPLFPFDVLLGAASWDTVPGLVKDGQ